MVSSNAVVSLRHRRLETVAGVHHTVLVRVVVARGRTSEMKGFDGGFHGVCYPFVD